MHSFPLSSLGGLKFSSSNFNLIACSTSAPSSMVRTKHVVARHSVEEISDESSSSSGEEIEMEVPPAQDYSEGSSAKETGEEASPRRGKTPEGRVSIQKPLELLN